MFRVSESVWALSMADDNIDFRFLGRQVQNLQGDVRDLRAGHLRLEGDVAGLRADISRLDAQNNARFDSIDAWIDRLEAEMRAGFKAVDTRFDNLEASLNIRFEQAHQTMATNFQLLLAAVRGRDGGAG